MSPPEIDSQFPSEFADSIARLESHNKHHYRPNSYLHKWWARRCGSTFRLILKGLVPKSQVRDYYEAGGLEGMIILDPMMGGGTTLHEAIRLGANVIGADLDPIPVLQARATLSDYPLAKLETAFDSFWNDLLHELGHLFKSDCPVCGCETDLRFLLYGAQRFCSCGPVILVDSLIVRHERDRPSTRICPRCHAINVGDSICQCPAGEAKLPLVEKRHRICPDCGDQYYEVTEIPFYLRYIPLVSASACVEHGLVFSRPNPADIDHSVALRSARASFSPTEFAISPGPKSKDLLKRGIVCYLDLFTNRQLAYIRAAIDRLSPLEPLPKLNLALLLSTSLEFNSLLCGYKGGVSSRPGAVRHTFAHHAYSFPYTALENNPLYPGKASGTLQRLFHDRIRRARLWALEPRERQLRDGRIHLVTIPGELDSGIEVERGKLLLQGTRRFRLLSGSSSSLDVESESVDAVVTDPPYYDSVQYSDLARFFHVWLRRMLPQDAVWEVDLDDAAVKSPLREPDQYRLILGSILTECRRVLKKENGRLIFSFHHWSPEGWIALTCAVKDAGFFLMNRYVAHAENPSSVHIANQKALVHDAILVFAGAGTTGRSAWPEPSSVDRSSSFGFCQDCASVLGWLLDNDFCATEIRRLWFEFLKP